MIRFILNRDEVRSKAPPGSVTLDILRRELGRVGTKEGCREGDCGACTVLLGERSPQGMRYRAVASCLLPIGALQGKHLVTIEGLNGDTLSPIQQAIVDEGATQCGFCTPGIVMALTGFLLTSESLSLEDAYAAIEGNICRCTGYASIRRAVQRLVAQIALASPTQAARVPGWVEAGLLPAYFLGIAENLDAIAEPLPPPPDDASAVPAAGGTDLFVQQPDRLRGATLRFLSEDPGLRGIRAANGNITIGAATTVEELLHSNLLKEALPAWEQSLRLVASTLIRNRATLAGNIVNASPIGDLAIILLALGAHLTLRRPDDALRSVPLDAFFNGYKQIDLAEDELITEITLAQTTPGSRFNFEKVSRREHLDIASVNSAMVLEAADGHIVKARVSAGGVAPIPLLLSESSAWLAGRPLSPETVDALTRRADAEIAPISDVRGTADYKRRLLRRLVIAHFVESFPELDLKGLIA
jgi:xanthine dehydrogenase small subunit